LGLTELIAQIFLTGFTVFLARIKTMPQPLRVVLFGKRERVFAALYVVESF
jgi:hypothetical protein